MVGSVYEVRPDWRVPGLVRRKTAVSRHESRGQERSGRSRSISRPTPRQTLEQTSRAHPSRRSSKSQHHGRQLRYPSLHPASPYYGQYASEDDNTSEDDELPENPYVSAPEDSRGRRRNPVGASSAAPLPQRYCQPTVSTLSMDSSHGQGSERDGDGGRDHRGAAPEYLQRNREQASYGRGGSQRGGVGSTAGIQQRRHPRSPQTFDLPLGQRSPPAEQTMAAPAPQPGLRDLLSTTGSRPRYEHPDSGMAPPRHAHAYAKNTVSGLQYGEGIARAGYASHVATDPPPPRPSPSLRRQNREPSRSRAAPAPPLTSRNPVSSDRNGAYASMNGRSGLDRGGKQERERAGEDEKGRRADGLEAERLAAEMGFEQAYQASMADRRRSIRKEGNHKMAGEEELSAAKPKSNPDPVAHPLPHTSGISSRQQAPPPPPLHTRPRSFLPQQQRPTHPTAAASHHPPPPPSSSAAPRPRIHKSMPTASNARDSLFGFSDQKERDDSSEAEGDRRADGLESTLRNPYLHPAGRGQESLKEGHHKRAGEEALRSANAHPQLSSGQRRRPPAPPPSHLPGRSDSRARPSSGMPQQQQRERPAHLAAAYSPAAAAAGPTSDRSDSSSSSSSAVPGPRNPAATSRGNVDAKVSSTGPRGGRVGIANTDPRPGSCPVPKREGANSVSGYGKVRKGAESPETSTKGQERAIPQHQRRPAHSSVSAATPPAPPAPSSRNLRPSSSVAPRSPHDPVHTYGTNIGPRAAVGARSTGQSPHIASSLRKKDAGSVSGYSGVRKGVKLPEPSTEGREREIPQRQRGPAHSVTAAPPSPTAPARNLPPSSSIPLRPRNPIHTNRNNLGPRAGGADARSTWMGPRTTPAARREGVRSVSVGGRGHGNFPNPSSPRWAASGRRGEIPWSAGHQRAGNHAQKNGKRKEEPKPTLTQKIGYKLWVSALSCM